MPPPPKSILMLACLGAAGALGGCASTGAGAGDAHYRAANLRPYEVNGHRYTPQAFSRYDAKGVASWYSYPSHTRRTATGEWYDPGQFTGAHKTLPLPCEVEVTNLANGRKVKVRINDRGPKASQHQDGLRWRRHGAPSPATPKRSCAPGFASGLSRMVKPSPPLPQNGPPAARLPRAPAARCPYAPRPAAGRRRRSHIRG